jgi:hypothetical protein
LSLKPAGNTSAYLSTTGQDVLASVAGDGTAASLFHDDTYSLTFTVERSGDDLVVSGMLAGENGFMQSLTATDLTADTLGTFTFDRLGFLLGNNLGTDQAEFSNLLVTFIEALIPGDYNGDDLVDAADYVVWRKSGGTQQEYNTWRANFGAVAGAGGSSESMAAVPEPTIVGLLSFAVILFGQFRIRGRIGLLGPNGPTANRQGCKPLVLESHHEFSLAGATVK